MATRHIYLRIEQIDDYSPVEPQDKAAPPIQYKRDGMYNTGHEMGIIPDAERHARALTAVVYREYLDPDYLIPGTSKIVSSDINEPIYDRRVPGAVLWVYVGETIKIHVLNSDNQPHSFHIHGIEYGIDSDGAWPMGTQSTDGRRSDEICPGQNWTYTFRITHEMIGAWPFHDHSSPLAGESVRQGLFGGIIVRKRQFRFPIPFPLPERFAEIVNKRIVKIVGKRPLRRDSLPVEAKSVLEDHEEFLREWLFRQQRLFRIPNPDFRLHVPVFFHEMMNEEDTPLFDSDDLEENGGVFSQQFDDAGSYGYFCRYHPIMTGTVEVVSGGPANAAVNILDAPVMNFYPSTIQVGLGGTVTWTNLSAQHHTVTSVQGGSMATHCINGRAFVGNSPTIVARAGQKIRWYVFNLDFGHDWHNFHPHNQRWKFADEHIDVRSMGPAESFTVDTVAPPVLILPDEVVAIQDGDRPADAQKYRLVGDYVFHCHVHHHLRNGMVGVVRAYQDVWLTPVLKQQLEEDIGIHLYDESNPIADIDLERCKKQGPGQWEELAVAPDVTFMHACLLANSNKVLYWGYTRSDQSRLLDPAGPTVSTPSNQTASLPGMNTDEADLWSAEHTFLNDAQGTVLAHGGFAGPGLNTKHSFLFDPATELWSQTGDTTDARFYSTTLSLEDGRPMTLFGTSSKSIEVYDPATGTWAAPIALPVSMNHHQYYPWTYLLPDGRLFIAGPHDPSQRLDWNPVGGIENFNMISGNRSTGGEKGTSILLPLCLPNYEPRVVVIGGNTTSARKTAEIIDLSQPAPAWKSLPNLNEERAEQVNSVLLPDGRVLVAGGANSVPGGGMVEILDSRNIAAGWEVGPSMTYHRGYHSAMIMLPDGSLLFGGDPNSGVFERYYPGYYYKPRPQITAAPAGATYGNSFAVDSPQASSIGEVLLIRPGAVTHGFNMAQRAIECAIIGGTATTLQIEAPPNGFVAPPGWYLLFVVDNSRVPSVGSWIRLTT